MMFNAYQNDTAYQLDDLTIENRADVVNIYGNLQLYQDKYSLEQALKLAEVLQDIIQHLQTLDRNQQLIDHVQPNQSRWVDNPFLDE